jgi:hypothetical protein
VREIDNLCNPRACLLVACHTASQQFSSNLGGF